jgi:hypothetical protein
VSLQRGAEARALIVEALPLVKSGSAEDDARLFQLKMVEAESYRYEQRIAASVSPFQAALQVAGRRASDNPRHVVDAATRLAQVLTFLDRKPEATQVLKDAIQGLAPNSREAMELSTTLETDLLGMSGPETLALFEKRHGIARIWRANAPIQDVELALALAVPDKHAASPPPGQQVGTSNAAQRVEELRRGFQACYREALGKDPAARGSVRLIVEVAANGSVASVRAVALGLSPQTVDCVLLHAGTARFDEPHGGSAVIAVPITFVPAS